jgi:thiol-disulfide isomerase/thioredoxin
MHLLKTLAVGCSFVAISVLAMRASAADGFIGTVSHVQEVTESTGENEAPDFSWVNSKGDKVSLKSLRGKVVFVNFWGTWCRPCRMELPDIVSLSKSYAGQVEFVGIAMERPGDDPLKSVSGFAKNQGITYQLVIGNDAITHAYGGLQGIPTTFIINKEGKIVSSAVGMRSREAFEEMLKKAL